MTTERSQHHEKMKTQTFAEKKGRERRVLLMVVSLFLLLEATIRLGGEILSKDIAHLRSFPKIARRMAQFDPQQGTRILFLGNSLTRHGVDQDAFAETVKQEGGGVVQSVKMNPDNTDLSDWFYAYRTFFSRPGIKPDVLIVGFEGVHLRDAPSRHPDRLAQYYCTWSDWPDLCQYDLKTFEDRVYFVLCRYSAAFGNRDRIQKRLLDKLIPDYRAGMDELNSRRNEINKAGKNNKKKKKELTYEKLQKLIAIADSQGTKIVLAAMPVPDAYQFDPKFLELVENSSAVLVDCRKVEGITEPMFFDGLHMDEQAAKIYSSELARKLSAVLKSIPRSK